MHGPSVSVVIPVWGREHNLVRLLPALRNALEDLGEDFEIIVSGHDSLTASVEPSGATFVPAHGNGYGDILQAGIESSRGAYVITMDSDFSHRPRYVRAMWAHRGQGDVLLASRYLRGSYPEMPLSRRLLSRLLNLLYRTTLSLPYTDLSSGFRMYTRAALEDIWPPQGRGLDVLPELVVKAVSQGWKIAEVPFWYRGAEPFARTRMLRLGVGYLQTLGRMFALRNSVRAADYDHRAFDSLIPLQRYWQRARFRIIQSYLPDTGLVLDIGCGSSRIFQTLPHSVGMDLAMGKLRWLRGPGRMLLQGDMNRLPFRDRIFEAIVCSEVIEHIPREKVRLSELVRVVRPGGTIILGTPDYSKRLWRFLEWVYSKVFPGGYVKEHINRYTYEGLRRELQDLDLNITSCSYVGKSEMIFKARRARTDSGERSLKSTDPAIWKSSESDLTKGLPR